MSKVFWPILYSTLKLVKTWTYCKTRFISESLNPDLHLMVWIRIPEFRKNFLVSDLSCFLILFSIFFLTFSFLQVFLLCSQFLHILVSIVLFSLSVDWTQSVSLSVDWTLSVSLFVDRIVCLVTGLSVCLWTGLKKLSRFRTVLLPYSFCIFFLTFFLLQSHILKVFFFAPNLCIFLFLSCSFLWL